MSKYPNSVYSTTGRFKRRVIKRLHRLRELLLPGEIGVAAYRILNPFKPRFTCPICNYEGPFFNMYRRSTSVRRNARCPQCQSMERHRLQFMVVTQLAQRYDFSAMRILHIAPEKFFLKMFREQFKEYVGANLQANRGVDMQADLRALPFADGQFDVVYASHVLEHIKDDSQVLSEVKRVLRAGGLAVLPVPMVADQTVEYPEPNPYEFEHVRAPGPDYYERYRNYFSNLETFSSIDFPKQYQLYMHEDRSIFPHELSPLRPPMYGNRHPDLVAVCFR
ncbi:MAG: class I SAM-dependent methyltransferase [Gammaproteobacteria bacterium]|nr:class I SAM-dependent methyltransferase [Gammaproteobacteria bacterium]